MPSLSGESRDKMKAFLLKLVADASQAPAGGRAPAGGQLPRPPAWQVNDSARFRRGSAMSTAMLGRAALGVTAHELIPGTRYVYVFPDGSVVVCDGKEIHRWSQGFTAPAEQPWYPEACAFITSKLKKENP